MIEIIAECGVNHDGSVHKARELIDAANRSGCDTVKFQLFHGDRYPELQIHPGNMLKLKEYAEHVGLKFLCTPDDYDDARILKEMGCDRIKIGSSNVTNLPLLRSVAQMGMHVFLSTGACSADELDEAVNAIADVGSLTVMHCVSAYPPPPPELNLSVIRRLARKLHVGYSDHSIGNIPSLVALGLGARTFEKHLTLGGDGPDHHVSLGPDLMTFYVEALRASALMLGDGDKRVMPCEESNRRDYEAFVKAQHMLSGI